VAQSRGEFNTEFNTQRQLTLGLPAGAAAFELTAVTGVSPSMALRFASILIWL
jgi:hypothetical protein